VANVQECAHSRRVPGPALLSIVKNLLVGWSFYRRQVGSGILIFLVLALSFGARTIGLTRDGRSTAVPHAALNRGRILTRRGSSWRFEALIVAAEFPARRGSGRSRRSSLDALSSRGQASRAARPHFARSGHRRKQAIGL
jgi:hypothetical protein